MSAFCDIALAVGLTLNGLCATGVVERSEFQLPADDHSAYALPTVPVEIVRPAPPPKFPPIVIREAPRPKAEPVVVKEAPSPPPDPLVSALTALYDALPRRSVRGLDLVMPDRPINIAKPVSTAPMKPVESALAPTHSIKTSDYEGDRRTSGYPVDNSRILAADRYISVVLETGINSQIGGGSTGTVNVQVSRDVYGYHGRNVLVPKGSRIICNYSEPEDFGSSRLAVECERILLAGHRAEIRDLGSLLADVQGRAGTSGEVDDRFGERYGTAFLLTGISTGVALSSAVAGASDDEDSNGLQSGLESGSSELSERLGEISAGVLERTLELNPIITVPQGTRLQIRPRTDWYIAKMEDY